MGGGGGVSGYTQEWPPPTGTSSLLPGALDHRVALAGVLEAGRGPVEGPAVGAGHRRLDVPLQEVEDGVPPGVREVVVGRALQSLMVEEHRNMASASFTHQQALRVCSVSKHGFNCINVFFMCVLKLQQMYTAT